jgi:hypothetical protein
MEEEEGGGEIEEEEGGGEIEEEEGGGETRRVRKLERCDEKRREQGGTTQRTTIRNRCAHVC